MRFSVASTMWRLSSINLRIVPSGAIDRAGLKLAYMRDAPDSLPSGAPHPLGQETAGPGVLVEEQVPEAPPERCQWKSLAFM